MSEQVYVVCLPTKGNENFELVPGSIVEKCSKCSEEVSISPATNKVRLEKGMVIVCMNCVATLATEEIARGEAPKTMPMTTDQFSELMSSWAPKPGSQNGG